MCTDEIGKEKKFEYGKYDDELDNDNRPKRSPQGHLLKSVGIQVIYTVPKVCLGHSDSYVVKIIRLQI